MMFPKICILGVGFMGASMAMAMKDRSLCVEVSGYGRNEETLKTAQQRGIVDEWFTDPAAAVLDADLVVLSTPVETFLPLLSSIASSLKEGAAVIDIGSIKGKTVYEMDGLTPSHASFVGCHPIAGSEQSGIDTATGALFQNSLCVITPTADTQAQEIGRITALWELLGAKVKSMTPEEHDKVYGLISHLPHVVAYALMNTIGDIDNEALFYAGKGLTDTTRVAKSSPDLWRGISMMNSENIQITLDVLIDNLTAIRNCLKSEDEKGLLEIFERARDLRETVNR
jgi:prephenate dehydrogenase